LVASQAIIRTVTGLGERDHRRDAAPRIGRQQQRG